LILVEGIDGSGKSTQIALLSQWLRLRGYAIAFSEWNSSPLVRETTRRGKKKEMFTPTSFSLIHATDFADRMERYILPLLKAGAIVCADRHAYTAFARDVVRGVDRAWVRTKHAVHRCGESREIPASRREATTNEPPRYLRTRRRKQRACGSGA
jgi:dTMP kinase